MYPRTPAPLLSLQSSDLARAQSKGEVRDPSRVSPIQHLAVPSGYGMEKALELPLAAQWLMVDTEVSGRHRAEDEARSSWSWVILVQGLRLIRGVSRAPSRPAQGESEFGNTPAPTATLQEELLLGSRRITRSF